MNHHFTLFGSVLAISLAAAGCSEETEGGAGGSGGSGEPGTTATAQIQPLLGSEVVGEATFKRSGDNVMLTLRIEGAPEGLHGVHIHENPDCGMEGEAAGPHWNPTGAMHGRFGSGEFHLGDIGNISVDADGHGEYELTTPLWTLGDGSLTDVTEHALIVHENADDYVSQPSGNAGTRIACGVISIE